MTAYLTYILIALLVLLVISSIRVVEQNTVLVIEFLGKYNRMMYAGYNGDRIPEVEDIQNMVEKAIADKGDFEVAKAYILYREERTKLRKREKT
jgi:regulator of protease activity HflC (stomatin/prohibitin superfamily)